MLVDEAKTFRERARRTDIAATHQRQVLYDAMKTMHGHPSPEQVYAQVKERVPVISLATVYKTYIYLWRVASFAR
jgi:Fur family transcriptional regulator, peroxide stress response regulator